MTDADTPSLELRLICACLEEHACGWDILRPTPDVTPYFRHEHLELTVYYVDDRFHVHDFTDEPLLTDADLDAVIELVKTCRSELPPDDRD
jgi:hypothetical protein